MTTQFTDGLNPQQAQAVTAGEGAILVLAGPGSGKTRVLTNRIAYLIGEMKLPPQAIMAVTFTNKAAGEMKNRVRGIIGDQMRGLQIGTFHSTCARLLRREGDNTPYGSDYIIYDSEDQNAVIKQTLNELNIDPKKFNPRRILGAISSAKNELITPSEYRALDYVGEVVARAYPRYQAILLDNNAMDFDDLLMQMVLLLRENDSLLDKYQRFFEYLLVDEFQDTNIAQYELVNLLGKPQDNLFVVGDEDQGIYAFRGADYRNVLRFRQDHPSAQVILLEQNYRSTQNVLNVARAIIDKNPNRTPKALFTDRDGGEMITVHEAYNQDYEAQFVIQKIDELCRKKGYDYNDFAVMYRTNAQSRALEEQCIREGIPYALIGGVGFYKRREVRDLLAYLRLINNGNDKISFNRIINVPKRGIGKKSVQDFQYWAANECENYDEALEKLMTGEPTPLSPRTSRLFAEFGTHLQGWRDIAATGDLVELIDRVIADVGYTLYARNDISDTPEQGAEREENIQEFRNLLAQAVDANMPLTEFLAEQSLVADVDSLDDHTNVVTLLTLHAAKGLEYPVVFITGLEEGLLPHARSFDDPDGMGEERRLMYVGVTRAEDQLFLTYAFRRMIYGSSNANTPSRFLSDLPSELVEGLKPQISARAEVSRLREEVTWKPMRESRLNQDLARERDRNQQKRTPNNAIRGKIIPFPSKSKSDSPARSSASEGETKFSGGQKVYHYKFGIGTVIESKNTAGIEEVTVAFQDRKHGIKTISGDYLKPVK